MVCTMAENVAMFVCTYFFNLQVSTENYKGANRGLLQSKICSDKCPTSCDSWSTFETDDDSWKEDPDLQIICKC